LRSAATPYVIDRDGKRYRDAPGGAAVSCLGHSDREVIDAIKAQLDEIVDKFALSIEQIIAAV
jgi:4-aminobutyrate aminotransferase-like enzyme